MTLLANLAARLRSVFRRGREDAETQEELRFHLEMETEKNLRAGLDPREARRRAHVRLGGVETVREAVRDARGMRPAEDLLRDLGYALRGARRNPGFALAAVVSLAVPIGLNTTISARSATRRIAQMASCEPRSRGWSRCPGWRRRLWRRPSPSTR